MDKQQYCWRKSDEIWRWNYDWTAWTCCGYKNCSQFYGYFHFVQSYCMMIYGQEREKYSNAWNIHPAIGGPYTTGKLFLLTAVGVWMCLLLSVYPEPASCLLDNQLYLTVTMTSFSTKGKQTGQRIYTVLWYIDRCNSTIILPQFILFIGAPVAPIIWLIHWFAQTKFCLRGCW